MDNNLEQFDGGNDTVDSDTNDSDIDDVCLPMSPSPVP